VQAELWSSLPPLQPAAANTPPPQSAESPAAAQPDTPKLALPDPGPSAAEIALEKKKAEEAQIEKDRQQRVTAEKAAREKEDREKAKKARAEKEKAELAEAERNDKRARKEAADELRRQKEQERLAKIKADRDRKKEKDQQDKLLEDQRRDTLAAVNNLFGDPKAKIADAGKDAVTKSGTADGSAKGERVGAAATYVEIIKGEIESRVKHSGAETSFLVISVEVSTLGKIGDVRVLSKSNNPRFDEAVKTAINRIKISGGFPPPKDPKNVEHPIEIRLQWKPIN
jgi:colicin import membrane protein